MGSVFRRGAWLCSIVQAGANSSCHASIARGLQRQLARVPTLRRHCHTKSLKSVENWEPSSCRKGT